MTSNNLWFLSNLLKYVSIKFRFTQNYTFSFFIELHLALNWEGEEEDVTEKHLIVLPPVQTW